MKKIGIVTLVFCLPLVAACNVDQALTAADLGIQVAKAIKRARTESPDSFERRARFYADFYCDIREEKSLDFGDIRAAAIKHGADPAKVDRVKSIIDHVCPAPQV
jgi:hypothetical protein